MRYDRFNGALEELLAKLKSWYEFRSRFGHEDILQGFCCILGSLMPYHSLTAKYPEKRAFITGAGSGLGLALASELARDGWHIGITDLDAERLLLAEARIKSEGGYPSLYVFDVANYEQFAQAVQNFTAKYSGIDIGINNAGIGCGGKFDDVPIETFRKIIEIDLMGVANGCHLFVPLMKKQQRGHILNVASAAAFATAPRMSAYSTAKAGVVALSECLRSELVDSNISISVLCPTYVRTNIGKATIGGENEKKYSQILSSESPLSAEEVALEALQKMASGKLYIVLPDDARTLWRLKRFMPERYWKIIKKAADEQFMRLDAKLKTDDLTKTNQN